MRALALSCLAIVAVACSRSARRSADDAGLGPRLKCPPGAHMEGSLLAPDGRFAHCVIPSPPGLETPWPPGPTVPHGPWISYWSNGNLQEDSVYDLGYQVAYKRYSENGNLSLQFDYEGREMVRSRSWFKDGTLEEDTHWRSGKPDGLDYFWRDDPKPRPMARCWVNGREVWYRERKDEGPCPGSKADGGL